MPENTTTIPTADEIAAAGRVVAYYLRMYSNGQMGLNEASDVAARAARLLAPAVYESAMDSGCTDIRPTEGAKRIAAWDSVVLAHVLNAVAP